MGLGKQYGKIKICFMSFRGGKSIIWAMGSAKQWERPIRYLTPALFFRVIYPFLLAEIQSSQLVFKHIFVSVNGKASVNLIITAV